MNFDTFLAVVSLVSAAVLYVAHRISERGCR